MSGKSANTPSLGHQIVGEPVLDSAGLEHEFPDYAPVHRTLQQMRDDVLLRIAEAHLTEERQAGNFGG